MRVGRIVAQQPLVEPQGFREDKDRYYHKKFVFSMIKSMKYLLKNYMVLVKKET